ncbi:hypothetical protein HYS93_04780, partial [Candidatus Daviesbacteria bacterium]|nr:hypothetical protein [Candidatus Daviesbacteria bacterium]
MDNPKSDGLKEWSIVFSESLQKRESSNKLLESLYRILVMIFFIPVIVLSSFYLLITRSP